MQRSKEQEEEVCLILPLGAIMTNPVSVVDLKAEIDKLASEYMVSMLAGLLRKNWPF